MKATALENTLLIYTINTTQSKTINIINTTS